MKQHYLENWGWNPTDKRNEMFHPLSKFLCIYESLPGDKSEVEQNEAQKQNQVTDDSIEKTVFDLPNDVPTVPLPPSISTSVESSIKNKNSYSERKIIAYAMFRFDWDDEDEPEYPVLYCYELQVSTKYQGCKIGSFLMQDLLINICIKLKLWKVLLTCFVSNINALKFYRSIGFDTDVNSPIAQGTTDCDYEILSNKPTLK